MTFSDEVLMAYTRGQLDEPLRAEVERSMRADPSLAARVARHRALRAHAYHTYGAVLDEQPMPPRIAGISGKVVQLDAVRAARQQAQQPAPVKPRWSWRQWAVLVAALSIGALEGVFAYSLMLGESGLAAVEPKGGALVAQGTLAQALSRQLSGSEGKVLIGQSFMSKEGTYCRSFIMGGAGGLACKGGERWHIAVMAETSPAGGLPPVVRDLMAQRIDGAALDEAGERAALAQGWRR
ncbi:MAG: hypothetical protein ACXWC2_22560 [Ramlibacter sp.]